MKPQPQVTPPVVIAPNAPLMTTITKVTAYQEALATLEQATAAVKAALDAYRTAKAHWRECVKAVTQAQAEMEDANVT